MTQRGGPTDPLRDFHDRLLSGDPTASAELAEAVIGPLQRKLERANPRLAESNLLADAVTDAVFEYIRRPEQFDPSRMSLLGYLKMAAQGDLKNALRKRSRRTRHEVPLDSAVEVPAPGGKEEMMMAHVEARRLKKEIDALFNAGRDRELSALVIDGERSTEVYARILGITDRPVEEQRREVKRHKDRITKRLTRYGRKLTDS